MFDADEALDLLNLGSMVVNREVNSKVPKEKVVKEKVVKEKVPKAKKSKQIPLPFSGVCDETKCQGICLNYGLYTQCRADKSEGDFCVSCASSNAFGTMEDRLKEGFKTPEGKSPVHFTTVMRKLRLTREEVSTEALKQGVEVSEDHFTIPEKAKKEKKEKKAKVENAKKGRPQKAKKVLELETSDIFSAMMEAASASEEEGDLSSLSSNSVSSNESEKQSSSKKSALKEQKEQEKAAKELVKKQKEEEKAAKELAKKQKEEEKAAKELAKQQKATLKSKSAKKSTKKVVEEQFTPAPEPEAVQEVAKSEPVKCVIINGKGQTKKTGLQESDKKFLKTSQGDILDFSTREVIGTWNKEEMRIVFNEDYVESEEEDEEEEEEYDE